MDRKKFIQNSSLLALGTGLFPSVAKSENKENASTVVDVVFLSDVHVKPTDTAQEGMRKAFRLANHLKPDFIINGGDSIMDAMQQIKRKRPINGMFGRKYSMKKTVCPFIMPLATTMHGDGN